MNIENAGILVSELEDNLNIEFEDDFRNEFEDCLINIVAMYNIEDEKNVFDYELKLFKNGKLYIKNIKKNTKRILLYQY